MPTNTSTPLTPQGAAPRLPVERVFVVRLTDEAPAGALAGRIEHVVSGCQQDFGTPEELLAALRGPGQP